MKSEFEFINQLKSKYNLSKIGDDAAVLPKDDKTDLVISTDMLVEDIDFRLEWTKPEFIGHKSLAVSLSDIAAMGAKPISSMVSVGIPEKIWKTDFVDEFYEGYMELANNYNVELIGGDVSKTPEKVVVDSIVLGEVRKGKAVFRSGAKPGDSIIVTGYLGDAATALKLLENGENFGDSDYDELLLRQLKPFPRTKEGQILCERDFASSMIDISDGLVGDLFQICQQSNVGATLYQDKIPKQDPNLAFHPIFNISQSEENIYYGGEDFELLFTVCDEKVWDLQKLTEIKKLSLIGTITSDPKTIELWDRGNSRILEPKGFTHF